MTRLALPHRRRLTRTCAAMAMVLAGAAPADATTLVVLVSDRAVVVGADSMRTLAGGGRETVCKVHHRAGVVFGFAGAASAEGFDAATIAAVQIAHGGTLADKASRTAEALQASLIAHFKARNVERTRRELVEGHRGRPVTGFLAEFVKGRPQVWLVMVLAEAAPQGVTLTTRVEPLDATRPDRAVFISAQHEGVMTRARERVGERAQAGVVELAAAAEELVSLDIGLDEKGSPEARKSGPPIAIAILDENGLRYAMPGVCVAAPAP